MPHTPQSSTTKLTELRRLCIHTITTKPWSLADCVKNYSAKGIPAITVWRQALEPLGVKESARLLKASGLRVTSICRGGFFPAEDSAGRQAAIADNKRAVDEAAAIGAPLIVLVCGAVPGIPLSDARKQITDGIAAVLPYAQAAGVKLGIEPLPPMEADSRSAVNTTGQATDMVEVINHSAGGIAVEVVHQWWGSESGKGISLRR